MDISFDQRPETYLNKERYKEPKDVFVLLGDLLDKQFDNEVPAGCTLTDFGCATGEMLYYLKHRFPQLKLSGVDNSVELLKKARGISELESTNFVEGDALEYRATKNDIVTCFGMLGIFDDHENLFESLIANTCKGGKIYIHGLFNDDDIDVRIYYKDVKNEKDWNRGFNIFSKSTISKWLEGRVASWKFHTFTMQASLPKNESYPHRAFTRELEDGNKVTTNGLCLILPEHVLEITC